MHPAIAVPDGRSAPNATTDSNARPVRPWRLRHWRSLVAALLALAVLVPVYAASAPAPVMAGGSCTGWKSITVPPDTIRVGRSDGTVDEVPFRRYVGKVMGLEWPSWLPRVALQVGAVAVKQYAWYHAMEGNHRYGFVNSRGRCYDVVDSTRDQLYKPEKVRVGAKIWAAVDRTWGLTLRKNGKFFMTGYRYGADVRCGRDADGWHLYERSVVDCAKRGRTMREIQGRYLNPGLTWHDSSEGALTSLTQTNTQPKSTSSTTPEPKRAPRPDQRVGPAPAPAGEAEAGAQPAATIIEDGSGQDPLVPVTQTGEELSPYAYVCTTSDASPVEAATHDVAGLDPAAAAVRRAPSVAVGPVCSLDLGGSAGDGPTPEAPASP